VACDFCLLVQFRISENCARCHRLFDAPFEPPESPPVPTNKPIVLTPSPAVSFQTRLSDVLRLRRLSLGLSQLTLAEKIGGPRSYISKYERAAVTPTIYSLERIATGLETSVFSLLAAAEVGVQAEIAAFAADAFLSEILRVVHSLTVTDRVTILERLGAKRIA
jgi:transcriptional regulator with XRE-family HTH domain